MHIADTHQITVIDLLTAEGQHVMQVGVCFIEADEAREVASEALAIYSQAAFAILTNKARRKSEYAA